MLYSCHAGFMQIFCHLLNNGGDIHLTSKKGVTALHLASAAGHLSIVKVLVEELNFSPTVTTTLSGSQPIHSATSGKHAHIVKYFMEECGLDPTVTDKNHEDCLTLAIKQKAREVAQYLINSGKFDLKKVLEYKGFNYFAYALVKGAQGIAFEMFKYLKSRDEATEENIN